MAREDARTELGVVGEGAIVGWQVRGRQEVSPFGCPRACPTAVLAAPPHLAVGLRHVYLDGGTGSEYAQVLQRSPNAIQVQLAISICFLLKHSGGLGQPGADVTSSRMIGKFDRERLQECRVDVQILPRGCRHLRLDAGQPAVLGNV